MKIGDEAHKKLIKELWRNNLELILSDTPEGNQAFYNRQDIYRSQFQTPFDDKLYMGTPQPWGILNEKDHKVEDYHTPGLVLTGSCSIEEAQKMRKKLEYWFEIAPRWMGLDGGYIAFQFEDLDPKTGVTIRDPRILGLYDKEKRRVIEVEDRDLTKEFYAGYGREAGRPDQPSIWDLLRDTKGMVEKEVETSGEPEKE